MVDVQWYEFVRKEPNGDRVYCRGNLHQFPLPVRSLLATGNDNSVEFETISSSRGSKGEHVLTKHTHDCILKYGNWDHGWVQHDDE